MATPKGYTDKEAIENYLLQSIVSDFDDQIDEWIVAIERTIDNITGRNFKADTVASARVYDGDGEDNILIDDAVQVTKVETGLDSYGGQFFEISASGADRYFLEPANYAALGRPIRKISLSARVWPEGRQNNRITAKWGYSVEVPDDIKFVATVFVAGIANQHRQGGAEIKSEKIGNYQVTYNSDDGKNSWADFENAKAILESYRIINI